MTKLSPPGNALVYSTYLGGSGEDDGTAIAVDAAGSAYVTGYTTSTTFPTLSPYQATTREGTDAFVTKLSPAGNALVYSTYLGGNGEDWRYGIARGRRGLGLRHGVHHFDELPHPVGVPGGIPGGQRRFRDETDAGGHSAVPTPPTWVEAAMTMGYAIAVDGADSAYVDGHSPVRPTSHPVAIPGDPRAVGDAFVTKSDAGGHRAGLLHLPGWKRR